MRLNTDIEMHSQTFTRGGIQSLFDFLGLHGHSVDRGKRIYQMKAGRQCLVADFAKNVDDTDMTSRDHTNAAYQQECANDDQDDEETNGEFHRATLSNSVETCRINPAF